MSDPKDKPGTDVAVATGYAASYPILSPTGAAMAREAIEANLGGSEVSPVELDRIGIPAGGGQHWVIPTIDGETTSKNLTGVIIAWQAPRAYWALSPEETGGGTPPDCSSPDGQYGLGVYGPTSDQNPTGACDTCPMNVWGSAAGDSKGKACAESRALYLMREGSLLPVTVRLPATSIQPTRRFMTRLAGEGIPYWAVVVEFTLERVSDGPFPYSVAHPKAVGRLSPEETAQAKQYGEMFAQALPRSVGTAPAV